MPRTHTDGGAVISVRQKTKKKKKHERHASTLSSKTATPVRTPGMQIIVCTHPLMRQRGIRTTRPFPTRNLEENKRKVSNAHQRHSTLSRVTLAAVAATQWEKKTARLCDGHRSRVTSAASQQRDRRGNGRRLQSSSLISVRLKTEEEN